MPTQSIIEIIEKYSTGGLSAEEEIMLREWLENSSPAEFHEVLDQCGDLPAGLGRVPVMTGAFAAGLEERLNEADREDRMDQAWNDESEGDDQKNGDDWKGEGKRDGEKGGKREGEYEIETNDNDENVGRRGGMVKVVRLVPWKKWAAVAACLLLVTATGVYFGSGRKIGSGVDGSLAQKGADVPPGVDGAILTLADGKKIVLDSAQSGALATEGNTDISKLSNGQLSYNTTHARTGQVLYNTLTTPRGRKTSVVLADGTRVWLNAASSLKYPTAFTGKERSVEITGEAYFEVAKNSAMPFVVKKAGTDYQVQVLGTRFNVNAYNDENGIKTTLLEGSVKIQKGQNNITLKPGQQAIVPDGADKITLFPDANLAEAVAWKNGIFNFDRADIHAVMRQLARWYDVDVEYKGTITKHFGGTIPRDVNVSQVFKMLELTGAVHFTIEGRKIEVQP